MARSAAGEKAQAATGRGVPTWASRSIAACASWPGVETSSAAGASLQQAAPLAAARCRRWCGLSSGQCRAHGAHNIAGRRQGAAACKHALLERSARHQGGKLSGRSGFCVWRLPSGSPQAPPGGAGACVRSGEAKQGVQDATSESNNKAGLKAGCRAGCEEEGGEAAESALK